MRAAFTAVVVAAFVLLGWFALHTSAPPTEVTATATPVQNGTNAQAPPEEISAAPTVLPREQAQVEATPQAAVPAAGTGPRAIVFGRCLDEDGHAIPAISMRLVAVDGEWAAGQEVPVVERHGWRVQQFEQKSSDEGRFRFDVPVPTADWIALDCETPEYFGLLGREFGPAGGRNRPRLAEGDNDLGDLVFPATGAVRGRVTDESGSPVAQAEVSLQDSFPGGRGVGTESASDGTYTLAHVPPCAAKIGVRIDGFLAAQIGPIDVRKGATSQAQPFVLVRAPSISGIVVDEAGRGVPRVLVAGWPTASGYEATAHTGEDGRFRMFLMQHGPHWLVIEGRGAFEDWGGHGHQDALFEEGGDDVRIMLVRAVRTTFAVVDAASGTPVDHYGLEVVARTKDGQGWMQVWETPKVSAHDGGKVTVSADPAQHMVRVLAPGYAPLETDVVHDSGTDAMQTLRLVRGAVLAGRIVQDKMPVPGATLVLARDFIKIDPTKPDDEDSFFDENLRTDLGVLAGRNQALPVEKDGSFRIPDLAPGTYQLSITAGKAAPKVVKALHLAERERLELGDIDLVPGGSVHGRVLLGATLSPVDLELRLDDDWQRTIRVASADGTFAIDGIAPGAHKLVLQREVPIVLEEVTASFTVAGGETRDVVIDARGSAPCNVTVHVVRAGKPLPGVVILAQTDHDGTFFNSGQLGETNESGSASGLVTGGKQTCFEVRVENGFALGRSKPEMLSPGGVFETTIAVQSGELVLVFPDVFSIPKEGGFELRLEPKDTTSRDFGSWTDWSTPSVGVTAMRGKPWTERRCAIGAVAPGTYVLHLNVYSTRVVEEKPNSYRLQQEPLAPPFESEVTIRDGEATVYAVQMP